MAEVCFEFVPLSSGRIIVDDIQRGLFFSLMHTVQQVGWTRTLLSEVMRLFIRPPVVVCRQQPFATSAVYKTTMYSVLRIYSSIIIDRWNL